MRILILANHILTLSLFRAELISALVASGYAVSLAYPITDDSADVFPGCELIDISVDRRGSNPLMDLKLFGGYIKLLNKIKPDVVLAYTVKPNLYGGLACRICKIPYMPNVTGFGSGMLSGGYVKKIIMFLSRLAFKKAYTVFVQNIENLKTLQSICKGLENTQILPGSGVNLDKFCPLPYPDESKPITFQFVARIMKEKGIDEYLEAAKSLKVKYPDTMFRVIGMAEDESYKNILDKYSDQGIIEYLGFQNNMGTFFESCHCTVNPSYSEGMSNVLLENAASARPAIASDIHGCKEIVIDGVTGYLCNPKDSFDLTANMERFINLPYKDKREMGLSARKKVVSEFDRSLVVDCYLRKIQEVSA